MGVLWWEIKYLKSAVTTFLKQKSIVPIFGIWNEIQWNFDLMTIDLVTNRDLVDSFVSGHLFEVSYGWNPFKHFVITIPKCLFLSWDIPIGHLKVFFVTMEVQWLLRLCYLLTVNSIIFELAMTTFSFHLALLHLSSIWIT